MIKIIVKIIYILNFKELMTQVLYIYLKDISNKIDTINNAKYTIEFNSKKKDGTFDIFEMLISLNKIGTGEKNDRIK